MTLTRQQLVSAWYLAVTVVVGGCGNESGRAPVPPHYAWPDSLAYHVTTAADVGAGRSAPTRIAWSGVLRLRVRNVRYLVWNDSVIETRSVGGAVPAAAPLGPEDTVRHFLKLTRFGALDDIQPDCDPSVAACGNVLPSALPRRLRHLIPPLPVWWPPRGYGWVDTLRFDDRPRPGGTAGSVVTTYRAIRDTAVAGRPCWRVAWRSVTVTRGLAGPVPAPMIETGVVLVDEGALVPALAWWRGSRAAAGGGTTSWGGSARLLGSAFDSVRLGP